MMEGVKNRGMGKDGRRRDRFSRLAGGSFIMQKGLVVMGAECVCVRGGICVLGC